MIDIDAMIGAEPPAVTVTVRGQAMTVRTLTAKELRAIDDALPEPPVPVRPPRGRGSSAAPEPDREDAGYVSKLEWCMTLRVAARVAVAMDIAVDAQAYDGGRDWIKAAADKIAAWLGEEEMTAIWQQARGAAQIDVEDAKKN